MKRTPLKRRNPERQARRRAEDFGPYADYVRTLPCAVCGKPGPSDPHHVKSRGAGGHADGNLLPLCREHHNEWDGINSGPLTFQAKYHIDADLEAVALWVQWSERP